MTAPRESDGGTAPATATSADRPADPRADLLAAAFWNLEGPLFLFDSCGHLILANRAGEELLGLLPGEAQGASLGSLFFSRDDSGRRPLRVDGLASDGPDEVNAHLSQGPRGNLPVSLRFLRLVYGGGERGLMCSVRCIDDADELRHEQVLARISSEIISSKPFPEVLEAVAKAMVDVAGVDHATITLRDEAGAAS